jgi:uncharacterized protein (TIGR02757 family)
MTLKQKLDYHYKAFDKSQISPDPLQFLHLFNKAEDIEAMGFVASIFAYGNVTQIINTLNKFLIICENKPHDFIINFNRKNHSKKLKGLIHRFYSENDVVTFFSILNTAYEVCSSLYKLFFRFYNSSEDNLKNPITKFSEYFIAEAKETTSSKKVSLGIKFMFPLPELGSACKRMNLFLRWMIRKDELDFGLWKEITPDKLIIPVDTHVARICKELKLTALKNVSWKMAEEITGNLKKYDSNDPVKYDFAICHIGMRKLKF